MFDQIHFREASWAEAAQKVKKRAKLVTFQSERSTCYLLFRPEGGGAVRYVRTRAKFRVGCEEYFIFQLMKGLRKCELSRRGRVGGRDYRVMEGL